MNHPSLPFVIDCLRQYAEALRSGELDGAGRYLPADIDEAADMLDTIASAQPPAFQRTTRGFPITRFKDRFDVSCSLQTSSLATESAIWFGVDDPQPQVMASDARALGIQTTATTGWIPYPIPPQVSINTRMHLTQETVRQLLPALISFAVTGDLPSAGDSHADT